MKTVKKNIMYNGKGQELTLTIQLRYEDLAVFEYPPSCAQCPCGFSAHQDCGCNTPFKEEDYHKRPSTCKLKLIKIPRI